MKTFCISDNTDTRTGMLLAGVEGVVVHTREEAAEVIESLDSRSDIGVILITEKLYGLCGDLIMRRMRRKTVPLYLEIPDRHGFGRSQSAISDFIRSSIGLNV